MSSESMLAILNRPVPTDPAQRLVLLVLADHADQDGFWSLDEGMHSMVQATQLPARSVRAAIRQLTIAGLLVTHLDGMVRLRFEAQDFRHADS